MARICVIRHWYYPQDPRVHREVDALRRAGHEVEIICLGRRGEPRRERLQDVSIWRVPLPRTRGGFIRYIAEYVAFFTAATILAGILALRRRYDIVQVNSLPDWLVFAAIVPKLAGARIVLDLHECMPEYYMTKYDLTPKHPLIRALATLEQASIAFANNVVTCTEQMRERFAERGADARKIGVVLNACDEDRFDPNGYPAERDPAHFRLISHGTLEENYGTDLVVRAVAALRHEIPGIRLEIYGDGKHRAALVDLVRELGVSDRVVFSDGFVEFEDLLPRIARADAGVVAIRRDAFRDLTHCNKMYDLVAMHRPVVISRTRAVDAYFGDDCFQYFESENVADLARAIAELYRDPSLAERLVRRASEVAEPYRWATQRSRYLEIVGGLLRDAPVLAATPAVEGVADR